MSFNRLQILGGVSQEEPLDLTVKKNVENQDLNKTEREKSRFDFPEWYTTYLNIANRQGIYYPSYAYQAKEITEQNVEKVTKGRKRKQPPESSEVCGKVTKLETDKKDNNYIIQKPALSRDKRSGTKHKKKH